MNIASTLKEHAEVTARALSENPTLGKSNGWTRVRLRDTLTCEIRDGDWRLIADLPEGAGGANQGPNPGVLIRAALGSGLAMDIFTWGARLEIPITAVDIEVHTELDIRGMLGVSDQVPPGYTEIYYVATVESTASLEDVLRVVEKAEAHNPRLYDLTHSLPVRGKVQVR